MHVPPPWACRENHRPGTAATATPESLHAADMGRSEYSKCAVILMLLLALAACRGEGVWSRTDGQQATGDAPLSQLSENDKLSCRGDKLKRHSDDEFQRCMAERGYVRTK